MESWIDLDQVATLISRHAVAWEESGLVVGPLTWRDASVSSPSVLREDREQVTETDSVGVEVHRDGAAGRLVVFSGGWADLEYWSQALGEPVIEAPGWGDWMDLLGIDQMLRRFAALFDQGQNHP